MVSILNWKSSIDANFSIFAFGSDDGTIIGFMGDEGALQRVIWHGSHFQILTSTGLEVLGIKRNEIRRLTPL